MESAGSKDDRFNVDAVKKLYQDGFEGDEEIRYLVADLKTGAEEVMHSSGLNRFEKFACRLTNSSNKTASMVRSCEAEILKSGSGARASEKLLDKALIKEYFDINWETHRLCENELKWFINSAKDLASCINKENKLDLAKIKDTYHKKAKAVVDAVDYLRNLYQVMLDKLNTEIKKVVKKLQSCMFWEKAVNVMSIGIMFGVFLCGLIAPPVAAFIIETVSLAQHWLLDMIEKYQSELKAYEDLLKSVKTGARETTEVLNHIKRQVDTLTAASDAYNKFKEEIINLDKAREKCISVLEEAGKEDLRKYQELKG